MSNIDLHNFQNDLIENDSFIRWVRSEFQEDDEQWSVFIDKHPDNFEDINAAISFIRKLEFKEDSTFNEKKVWDKIVFTAGLDMVKSNDNVRTIFPDRFRIVALLVAACFLLLVVFRMGISSEKEINTKVAHQMTESLPDGSNIIINAESKVRYNPSTWKEARTVNLEGTAFFKVEKGSKFVVKTQIGEVTVLGTSFSVTCRKDNFEVICKTGRVAVKSNSNSISDVILKAGDRVVFLEGKLIFDPETNMDKNNISWLDGVYTFEEQPLSVVIGELERQFDMKVSMPSDLQTISYTGFFRNSNLDAAIKSVTWPLGLRYKIDGNKVEFFK